MSEIKLFRGDSREILDTIDENSVDTCITDPPYHLTSIVERFGGNGSAPAKHGVDGVFQRMSAGFLGQEWDGGDIAFDPEMWKKVYRVLKPGSYLLAFGGTRTYHRMACAVEDAGFIVYDCAVWAHGQGFPKAYNVSKGIDKYFGEDRGKDKETPITPEAQLWNGWRTALKPAIELIVIAMKPRDGTYVRNALKWGVAGFNIDGTRIVSDEEIPINKLEQWSGFGQKERPDYEQEKNNNGRYPANLILDDSNEVRSLFPDTGISRGGRIGKKDVSEVNIAPAGEYEKGDPGFGDSGSAARFFYCAKTSKSEKNLGMPEGKKNNHPTVKPLSLMQHLVALTKTPTGGVVLDPFMGSGTTGCACVLEGRDFIGIEGETEYFEVAQKRIEYYNSQPRQIKLL